MPSPLVVKKAASQQDKLRKLEERASGSSQKEGITASTQETSKKSENSENVADAVESITTTYTAIKPQWLGAVAETEVKSSHGEAPQNMLEGDKIVDYKDRKKVLGKVDTAEVGMETSLENAAPGLLITKRKLVEQSDVSDEGSESTSTLMGSEIQVEDAVALLLKHKKGYHGLDDDEVRTDNVQVKQKKLSKKDKKMPKRILGPERPSFLDSEGNYDETWVPPKGQSGDGRTALNDRFGY